jgi:hypothetical protein
MGGDVEPADIVLHGISTVGCADAGCTPCTPVDVVGTSLELDLGEGYAASLGSKAAFADCYLTPDEIAIDPEAAAFAASFQKVTAATMGDDFDPARIAITGISVTPCTPGDDELSTQSITITEEYLKEFAPAAAYSQDCMVTTEEIYGKGSGDIDAYIEMIAQINGYPHDPLRVELEIHTDCDEVVGCDGPCALAAPTGPQTATTR